MTKTLEQLQAEAQAAAEALRAAELAAAEAKREEERAARRKIEEERERAINQQRALAMAPIIAALHAAGVPAKPNDNGTGFSVPTAEGNWHNLRGAAVMEEKSAGRYSYRSYSTGRVLIELEGTTRDDRRRFPPLKAGGHNVEKIVATIQDWLEQSQARGNAAQEKARALQSGEALAKQVRKDNGYAPDDSNCPIRWQQEHSYPRGSGRYEYHTYTPAAGKVYVQIGTYECTPEEAKILLDALKAIQASRKAAK